LANVAWEKCFPPTVPSHLEHIITRQLFFIKKDSVIAKEQGWGPRGLSSSSRTARGPKIVALASNSSGLGLGL